MIKFLDQIDSCFIFFSLGLFFNLIKLFIAVKRFLYSFYAGKNISQLQVKDIQM